jgi:hypothetical protein
MGETHQPDPQCSMPQGKGVSRFLLELEEFGHQGLELNGEMGDIFLFFFVLEP